MQNPPFVIGLTVLVLLTAGCTKKADYYLEKGRQSVAAGNDADAILNFQKALQKNAQLGPAHYALGLAYVRQKNVREAFRSLNQAAGLMPGSLDAQVTLADLCLNIYRLDKNRPVPIYSKIVQVADQILAKNAAEPEGLRLKGNLAMLDGNFPEAVRWLRQADQAKPMQSNIVLPLARSLMEAGEVVEGEQTALRLIEKERTFGPAYDLLYTFYLKSNRQADAEHLLQRKVENDPNAAGPRLQLAAHYAMFRKREEVRNTIQGLLDKPKDIPKGHLQAGDFYVALGDFEEAMARYQEGLKANSPEKPVYEKRIIDLLAREGKREEAARMTDAALKANPKDDELRTAQAILLASSGNQKDMEAATAIFQELTKENPRDPGRHVNLARTAMLKSDWDSATKQLQTALKLAPSSIPLRVMLANANLQKRDFAEALALSGEILKAQPKDVRARLMRAASLIGLGRNKDARQEVDLVLAAQPDSLDGHMQLGSLDLAQGSFKDAERAFRKAAQVSPGSPRPVEGLAAVLFAQNQPENALRVVKDELAKSPDSVALRAVLASTAMRAGNLDLAIEQYRQILAGNPGAARAYLQLGEALRDKGDFPGALAEFEKGRRLFPQDYRFPVSISAVERLTGRKDAALKTLREALAMQADNAFIMNNLAYLIQDGGGDLQEAQKLAQQALQRHPQQPEFQDTLGAIYQKTGQTESAISVFNSLIKQYPESPAFRYHLALCLVQKGDRAKAREALAAALARKPVGRLESDIKQLQAKLGR